MHGRREIEIDGEAVLCTRYTAEVGQAWDLYVDASSRVVRAVQDGRLIFTLKRRTLTGSG